MREKIAIPTQSLNIYLVSLTFISLSYNGRLSAGPRGTRPPVWTEEWEVVGTKVAFKDADFSLKDLLRPGVENAIIECADKKVSAGAKKGGGKKPAGSGGAGGTIKVPKRPRRNSSFGPRTTDTDPDGLFLVRSKNRPQSRPRVNPGIEIVKADYDFESDSGSGSTGLDREIYSPRRPRSPPRGGGGDGAAYEDRYPGNAPDGEDPDDGHSGGGWHVFSNSDDEDETSQLLQVEREGYRRARGQIKRDRKDAIREMTNAVADEAEASENPDRRSYSRSAEPGEPDVRAYMEVRYGVIIDAATPEEEAINSTRSYTRTATYLNHSPRQERGSVRRSTLDRSDEESRHRSRVGEHLYDSDISSDPESEPEIRLHLGRDSSYRRERMSKEGITNRENLFTIPRTEYISRTETYERTTATSDRDRERFLREQERSVRNRETSMLNREESLRERERVLAARERGFYGRPEAERPHSPPFIPGARSPSIVVQPYRPEFPHTRSHHVEIRPSPGDHRRPPQRAASYSGPSEEVGANTHSSEDDSMYGPQRPEIRRQQMQQIRRRNSRSSSDDDKEFIVERRRK